jgi:hypothetical protein
MNFETPKYSNADRTLIDVILDHPVYGKIPFTATYEDTEPYGREIMRLALAGHAGPVADYVAPESESPISDSSETDYEPRVL